MRAIRIELDSHARFGDVIREVVRLNQFLVPSFRASECSEEIIEQFFVLWLRDRDLVGELGRLVSCELETGQLGDHCCYFTPVGQFTFIAGADAELHRLSGVHSMRIPEPLSNSHIYRVQIANGVIEV